MSEKPRYQVVRVRDARGNHAVIDMVRHIVVAVYPTRGSAEHEAAQLNARAVNAR